MPVVPYNIFKAITASDSVDLPGGPTDAVYIGVAGNLVAVDQNGTTCTFAVVAGQILPIRVKRINSTSTTATGLVALYKD